MKLNIVLWALSLSTWFVSHLPRCVYQIIPKKKCGLCWLPNTVCLLHFSMLWAFHELNDNMIIRWFILVLNTWRYHEYDNLLNRVVKKMFGLGMMLESIDHFILCYMVWIISLMASWCCCCIWKWLCFLAQGVEELTRLSTFLKYHCNPKCKLECMIEHHCCATWWSSYLFFARLLVNRYVVCQCESVE